MLNQLIAKFGVTRKMAVLLALGLALGVGTYWRVAANAGAATKPSLLSPVSSAIKDVFASVTGRQAHHAAAKASRMANTLTVTKTADTNDGACDADCSLREAVAAAAAGDSIVFASPLFDSAQTISLNGQILIAKSLNITGKGAALTTVSNVAAANATSRVFLVNSGTVSLAQMTISGGNVDRVDSNSGCASEICGAAIQNNATLTVTDMVFSNNRVSGTIINGLRAGGAISSSQNASLTVINSTFTGNSVSGPGTNYGGAIYSAGTLRVYNSTISGNTVSTSANGTATGGGIVREGGTAVLINTTIANNVLSGASAGSDRCEGGGIFQSANFFGDVTALNLLVANNSIGTCQSFGPDYFGTLNSLGNNLIGNTTGATINGTTTGNLLNQNPLLGPLGYYGGSVPTRPLANTSPAVNAGNNCVVNLSCASNNPPGALPTDQRGAARVGTVDIGAFEVNNTANGGSYRAVLPDGRINIAYSYLLIPAVGAFTSPSISSGALPNGVTLQTSSGALTLAGTPTQAGTFNFSLSNSDGAGTFTVDYRLFIANENVPPDTTLLSTPANLSNTANATFTFTGSDNVTAPGNLMFECSLDNQPYAACVSPQTYNGLSDGAHTFAVRAKDEAGNTDPTSATFNWTIDATAPAAPVVVEPSNNAILIFTNQPTVTGTAEPLSTVTVYIDNSSIGTPPANASGNWSLTTPTPLADAVHTVRATATDAAGNVSPNSATNSFTVARFPPALGNYPTTDVDVSGNTIVTPDAAPSVTTYATAFTSSAFKGTLAVDPATGIVRVTNAHPAGNYTVTVKAFGISGTATKTFLLRATTLTGCNTFSESSFLLGANYGVGNSPQSVAVGDFNGDGRQDLVTANASSSNISVLLRNAANDGYESAVNYATGGAANAVAAGDFDGDGRQDIAVANRDTGAVAVLLRNAANNGFAAAVSYPANGQLADVAVADFNGDGRADIATANGAGVNIGGNNNISVFLRNAANDGFEPAVSYDAGGLPNSIAIGDFNGDDRKDIVVATTFSGNVVVFLRNAANNGFDNAVTYSVGGNSFKVATGDFNGDGKQDIASTAGTSIAVLLRNAGNNGFDGTNYTLTSGVNSIVVGDFNNDGRQDLVGGSGSGGLGHFLTRKADNSGFDYLNFGIGTNPADMAVGDFDGDGRQDIALANFGDGLVNILQRTCNISNCVTNPVVTTNADSGAGSLRQAITNACAGSTITFSGVSTVTLTTAELPINKNLTINGGNGVTVTRQTGSPNFRIFSIGSGSTVALNSLTISNGAATSQFGAGITNSGTLTVTNSIVSGNTNSSEFAYGGGVYNDSTLTFVNSTATGNTVIGPTSNVGGGIFNQRGYLRIINSTLSGNNVSGGNAINYGGGLSNNAGISVIVNSTIVGNTTAGTAFPRGGGVFNDASGTVVAVNSLIAGNTAPVGIDFFGNLTSAGSNLIGNTDLTGILGVTTGNILNTNALLASLSNYGGATATHALLPGSPAINGGTILPEIQTLKIAGSAGSFTLTFNGQTTAPLAFDASASAVQSALTALSTVGAGNLVVAGGAQNYALIFQGTLAGTNQAQITGSGSGGATVTLNTGADGGALATDQRGIARPQQSTPDIGAFESRGFTIAATGGSGQTALLTTAFANPLVATVTNSFNEPVAGGLVAFTAPDSGASATIAGTPATINANGTATTGTVTANNSAGSYVVTPSASGASGSTNFALTNSCPTITVTNPTTTTGTLGVLFSQNFTQAGGSNVTFSTSSTLPTGLTLGTNGTLSGTPTQSGTFPIVVRAAQTNGCFGDGATYTLTITTACVTNPAVTTNADSGAGSLRQAIADACPGSTISFANGISLITLTSGQLVINKNLTIQGPGANALTISGNNASRVFQISSGVTAIVDSVTIANGRDANQAGGILNNGSLTLLNCAISGNSVNGTGPGKQGGGIYNAGTLTLANSTLANNFINGTAVSTLQGGGLYNAGSLTITNSTVSGNYAAFGTGKQGGGIFNASSGSMTITNSTLTGNAVNSGTDTLQGGGIFNSGGTVRARNSIIAGNTGSQGPDVFGTLASLGYNLIGATANATIGGDTTGNLLDLNAQLAPLGNNGGPTQTHALLSGSPAINAGNNCVLTNNCSGDNLGVNLTTDQRGAGFNRQIGGTVDIGAFELSLTASAGGPYTISEGGSLTLSGSANGSGLAYSWDVNGDGTFGDATGQNPTLTWTQLNALGINDGPAVFNNVRVRVSDGVSPAVDSAATSLTVNNTAPAITNVSTLFVAFEGTPFRTVLNFSDPAGANDTYTLTINWGDGNTSVIPNAVSGQEHFHTYADGPVSLTQSIYVTDSDNASSATFSRTVEVVNAPPAFTGMGAIVPATMNEGSQVTVTATFTDPSGANDTYTMTINWGDGNTEVFNNVSFSQTYTHTYADGPATRQLDFQVNDEGPDNQFSPHLRPTLTVLNVAPTLTLSGAATVGIGMPYTLNLSANDPGQDTISSWTINWGDGSPAQVVSGNPSSVTHSYISAPNTFTISATATDEDGTYAAGNTVAVTVTCTNDPVVTTNADSGAGSLREAIAMACPGSTITFAANVTGTITLTSGVLAISKNLQIQGPGAKALTISGNNNSRVFSVLGGAVVSISGLTITGGNESGIFNQVSTLTVSSCTISNNAGLAGAGINNTSGTLTVIGSTLSNNTASGNGGGIFNSGGTATVINSTISSNSANNDTGGGISTGGTLVVVNSTLYGNTASREGGGIYRSHGSATVTNSIIAGSTGGDIGGFLPISGNNNLVQDGSGGMSNTITGNPHLGPLADNSGPTQTHALLTNSPALNTGSNTLAVDASNQPLTTDQRGAGFNRQVGGTVDIGAFEANYVLTATGGTPQSATVNAAFANPLQATLTESGQPISGVQLTFSAPGSGASAAFPGGNTATTNASGQASVTATANNLTGSYTVTANTTPGLATAASFSLTNTCPTITATVSGGGTICPTGVAQVNVTVSGGQAPYTVTLTNGGGTQTGAGPFTFNVSPASPSTFSVQSAVDANGCPVMATGSALVTVNPATAINSPPTGQTRVVGQSVTFSVGAAGANLSYQWRKGGQPILNATQNSFTINAVALTDQGSYDVVVTGTCGMLTSSAATLTVTCPTITLGGLPQAAAGTAYNTTLQAGPAGGNYQFSSANLPAWLSLAANGSLSGTPPATGTFNFTVSVSGFGGACQQSIPVSLTVVCPTVTLTPAAIPNAEAGTLYNQQLTATPAGGGYGFTLAGGLLPSGISLSATGLLSGTTTQTGVFNFRVSVAGFAGQCTTFRDYVLAVSGCAVVTISPATLSNGTVGAGYNQTISATPGGAYNFSVTSGALPPGLMLNAANGSLTGIPATAGAFSFRITATAGSCSGARDYSVTINCPGLTLGALPNGAAGNSYSQTISVSPAANAGSYTFSLQSGNLPTGLSLNPNTGAINGLPTVAGTYSFTVKAQTANGCAATQNYALTISCPAVTLSVLPTPALNTPYAQTVTASPSGGNYSFAVTAGVLPAGLSLNSATGLLSGTPLAAGAYNFTITATGFGSCTGALAHTGTIAGSSCPTITLPDLPAGQPGQLYNQSVSASPSGSYSYAVTAGNLPPGLTLYASFGLIYGYPTTAGTYGFTITATNTNNCTSSKQYSLSIGGAGLRSLVFGDFDGDGKADLSVWRGQAGNWLTLNSGNGKLNAEVWGSSAAPYFDVMTPGDYDGDGKMDLAVFRRQTGEWLIKGSRDGAVTAKVWGLGTDVPVPGDYDGDGKTDLAVWRGAESNWYILLSGRSSDSQTESVSWGTSRAPYRDIPVPADYDGDGKTDVAIFRQQNGHWYIRLSSDGSVLDKAWGVGSDVPVAADYDGDGKADIAVWRGADANWYVLRSSDGQTQSISWGTSSLSDVPAPGDYDGDGKADATIWRAADGVWHVKSSRDGSVKNIANGQQGDLPLTSRP